jgi:hypothetical protein
MSKLKEFIELKQTYKRYAIEPNLVNISLTEEYNPSENIENFCYTEYQAQLKLSLKQLIRENANADELIELKKHAQKLFIEEIFGEFRQPILKIKRILFERRNTDEALKQLDLLYKQMFD